MVKIFESIYRFAIDVYEILTTSLVSLGEPIFDSWQVWADNIPFVDLNIDFFRNTYKALVTFFGLTDGTLIGFMFGAVGFFIVFTIIKWVIDLIF